MQITNQAPQYNFIVVFIISIIGVVRKDYNKQVFLGVSPVSSELTQYLSLSFYSFFYIQ